MNLLAEGIGKYMAGQGEPIPKKTKGKFKDFTGTDSSFPSAIVERELAPIVRQLYPFVFIGC